MSHRAQSFLILLPFHFPALSGALHYSALEERLELKGHLLPSLPNPAWKQPPMSKGVKPQKFQLNLKWIHAPFDYSKQSMGVSALSLLENIPCSHVMRINSKVSLTAKRVALFFHSSITNTHELSWDEKQAHSSRPWSQQFWTDIWADLSKTTFTSSDYFHLLKTN